MGYDLTNGNGNEREYFRFSVHHFPRVLHLAHLYGWQPRGTIPSDLFPDDAAQWDGGYFSNEYQLITPEDCRDIKRALEEAFADVPDSDISIGNEAFPNMASAGGNSIQAFLGLIEVSAKVKDIRCGDHAALMRFFSHPWNREKLADFIIYLGESEAGIMIG